MRLNKTLSFALLSFLLQAAALGQGNAPPPPAFRVSDGPATAELRRMVKADQADRAWALKGEKPTEAQLKQMMTADAKRLVRVRLLVQQDKIVTAEDFDNAALLFQHGETPDDILIAHELAFVAQLKATGRSANNLIVLAEDRFLERIGRKQRFGSQGRPYHASDAKPGASQISDVDEDEPLAVSDALRADLFMPPLAASKAKGPMAVMDYIEPISQRLRERYNPTWQAEQAKSPTAQEMKRLASAARGTTSEPTVARVLEIYRADALRTAQDYHDAALLLLNATPLRPGNAKEREVSARRLLLAHELATVAALRKHPDATRLFARTLDRFLVMAHQQQRYGTYTDSSRGGGYPIGFTSTANLTVRRTLGVAPRR